MAHLDIDSEQLPLTVVDVIGQVEGIDGAVEVDPVGRVDPRAEAQFTHLIVEGEVGDVDLARAQQLDGDGPENAAVVGDEDVHAVHEAGRRVVRTGGGREREQVRRLEAQVS